MPAPAPLVPPTVDVPRLHDAVLGWFAVHARDLPWRSPDCSPWGVLVSEIMLQQTPVVRVLPRWREWLERWPTPADLAAAPTADVLTAWDRLGYPRRALRLQEAARAVVERHDGRVPADPAALRALPGIGEYTAAAVASFAFGIPETVVDTNVRRVIARAVAGEALPGRSLTRAEMRRAQALMPEDPARANAWNAAVMELGALVCTARSPACDRCPLAETCAWVAAGSPPPVEVPRGQAWAGTDRQVRGAVMAAVREHGRVAEAEVPAVVVAGGRLGSHRPEDAQWARCVAGQEALGAAGGDADERQAADGVEADEPGVPARQVLGVRLVQRFELPEAVADRQDAVGEAHADAGAHLVGTGEHGAEHREVERHVAHPEVGRRVGERRDHRLVDAVGRLRGAAHQVERQPPRAPRDEGQEPPHGAAGVVGGDDDAAPVRAQAIDGAAFRGLAVVHGAEPEPAARIDGAR